MPLEIVERLGLNRILLDCRHRHPLASEKVGRRPFFRCSLSHRC
jgi:hypothetical protein